MAHGYEESVQYSRNMSARYPQDNNPRRKGDKEGRSQILLRRPQCSGIHTNDGWRSFDSSSRRLLDKARLGCRLSLSSPATISNQFHRRNANQNVLINPIEQGVLPMRHRISRIGCSTQRAAAAMFVCVLLLLSAAPISQAQSGRRPPKQPTAPDPLPPKAEEPPVKPSSDQNS